MVVDNHNPDLFHDEILPNCADRLNPLCDRSGRRGGDASNDPGSLAVCAFYRQRAADLTETLFYAQKAEVPIVVCTLKGTADILKNAAKLKPTHVQMHLLDVIPAEDLKGRTTVDISDQVYEMMIADLGESYRPDTAITT
jgi:hypothetical protein